ncbi:MAG: ribosome biogenesis factor YjgA [Woeseia sp.]
MNSKPSKSAKKREAQAIDSLAKRLLELNKEQLAGIPLDAELRAVVEETGKITANSALRRQRLYLAKQLRRADVTEIQRACDALERAELSDQKLFHQAERWRDRLLAEREAALGEFSALTGRASTELARLVSELGKDLPEARERRVSREIFREIHAGLSSSVQDNAGSL